MLEVAAAWEGSVREMVFALWLLQTSLQVWGSVLVVAAAWEGSVMVAASWLLQTSFEVWDYVFVVAAAWVVSVRVMEARGWRIPVHSELATLAKGWKIDVLFENLQWKNS